MNKQAKTNAVALCTDFLRSGLKAIHGHLTETLALVAGGALFFIGFAEVFGAFDPIQSLNIADPIFGISFRRLMLAMGIAQLTVSLILLFTNWKMPGLGLAAWVAANFLVFRGGLWSMGWHHAAGFMVGPLGLSPAVTDSITSQVSLFLLVTFGCVFLVERRRARAAGFQKTFCPACGGHIRFAIQNFGQQIPCPHCKASITLRQPDNLKMTCVLCGGHVEFPAHAVGQKIPCPHCAKNITLVSRV